MAQAQPSIPTRTISPRMAQGEQVTAPDWSQMTFNNLPNFSEGGSFQASPQLIQQLGFDPSMTWQAGDRPADMLKMGAVQDFGVGNFSLNRIGQLTGIDMNSQSLQQFQDIMQHQSLNSLAQSVRGLDELPIGQSKPLMELAAKGFMGDAVDLNSISDLLNSGQVLPGALEQIKQLPVQQVLSQFPQIGDATFGNMDLSQFKIGDIQNLDLSSLKDFEKWQDALTSQVPGLNDVPMDKMDGILSDLTDAFIAKVDVPLGDDEQDRDRSVSGSFQQGFHVVCSSQCEHAELTPIAGSQMDIGNIGAFANGKAWMSRLQLVHGGFGPLGATSGGMEPTGRHPYGTAFKQVITTVDQAGGMVQTSMFMRYCQHPFGGCTPYIIGPVPFLPYREKDMIILGTSNPVDSEAQSFATGGDPLSGSDGFTSCGGQLTGEAVDAAVKTVDKVAAAYGSTDSAFATDSAHGQQHIPGILAALKNEGITCPAQVAYVLATVNRETSFANLEEGDTRNESDSESYWGRGYVQITHRDAYERAGQALGIDLVNHPEMATQPDVAAKILAKGFKQGWFGTQEPIDQAIPCNGQVDYVGARRLINDSAEATTIAEAANMYYDALTKTSQGLDQAQETDGGCSSNGGSGGPAGPAGDINKRIVDATNKACGYDTSTAPGTDGGSNACAWSINNLVLKGAGIAPIGSNSSYVPSVEQGLQSGRGTAVDCSQAAPGDIVIAAGQYHIGVCMTSGCSRILSNSSSKAVFCGWESGADFDGYYQSHHADATGHAHCYRVKS